MNSTKHMQLVKCLLSNSQSVTLQASGVENCGRETAKPHDLNWANFVQFNTNDDTTLSTNINQYKLLQILNRVKHFCHLICNNFIFGKNKEYNKIQFTM